MSTQFVSNARISLYIFTIINIFIIYGYAFYFVSTNYKPTNKIANEVYHSTYTKNFNNKNNYNHPLINVIIFLESNFKDSIVSKSGSYVGCLQMHKCYVDGVNLKIGYDKYCYDDRYNRYACIDMFYDMSNSNGLSFSDTNDWECITRRHIGGPNGCNLQSTLPRWNKVKKYLKEFYNIDI